MPPPDTSKDKKHHSARQRIDLSHVNIDILASILSDIFGEDNYEVQVGLIVYIS
jgi:hypothetical protein